MANRIVLYDAGKNPTLVGTADGQVPTWNNTTQSWSAQTGGGGGGVTSVTLDAGTTGLTVSGVSSQTITTSGTFLLAGTLAIANGGTGLSSAGGVADRVLLTTDGTSFSIGTVPNAALAFSSVTVTAGTGLSGGGSVSLGDTVTISLPNVGTAATYGSASQVPVFTTDAQGRVSSVTNTSIAIAASQVSEIPYDVSGEYPGTPSSSEECFHFIAVRACTIKATGSRGYSYAGPTGGAVSFDIKKNGSSIGTIDFADGSISATVTITGGLDVSVADGDRIVIVAPASLYGIDTPFWTLKTVVA